MEDEPPASRKDATRIEAARNGRPRSRRRSGIEAPTCTNSQHMRIRKRHIGITIDGMNSEIHTVESKTGAEAPVLAKHFEVADGTPTHDDRNHNPYIGTACAVFAIPRRRSRAIPDITLPPAAGSTSPAASDQYAVRIHGSRCDRHMIRRDRAGRERRIHHGEVVCGVAVSHDDVEECVSLALAPAPHRLDKTVEDDTSVAVVASLRHDPRDSFCAPRRTRNTMRSSDRSSASPLSSPIIGDTLRPNC